MFVFALGVAIGCAHVQPEWCRNADCVGYDDYIKEPKYKVGSAAFAAAPVSRPFIGASGFKCS